MLNLIFTPRNMVEDLLKRKGVRRTDFRLQVLEVFESNDAAVDLDTIESALGDFDRITLYRTVKTFLEKGLIHEINLNGIRKYALCDRDCGQNHEHHHEHVHFRCRLCDEVYCVEIARMPTIDIPNYEVEEMEIQLTGICENCKKN